MNILSVKNLVKSFRDVIAVDHISFDVPEGICLGLLGPNGAGKTTTIEMLEGLVKPSSGEILYFGELAATDVSQHVGIQFQHTSLPDHMTVKETLKLFASFYTESVDLDELIKLCALEDFANRDARRLSGGQRQRLLLALALVNDPRVVFLDEPTTGLDPQARRNFWDLVQKIKAKGKTVLLTTHYMDEAQYLCDELLIIDKGKVVETGSPDTILSRHFDGVLIQLPKDSITDVSHKLDELTKNYSETGSKFEILTSEVDATLSELMRLGIPLQGLQVRAPTLEDLFLKLTGHQLRA